MPLISKEQFEACISDFDMISSTASPVAFMKSSFQGCEVAVMNCKSIQGRSPSLISLAAPSTIQTTTASSTGATVGALELGKWVGCDVVGISEGIDEVGKLDGVGVGFNVVVGVSVGIEVGLNVGKLGRVVGVAVVL